ncbi:MAG: alpha/beta fold hydrolase [Pseudomonadota bacterium]
MTGRPRFRRAAAWIGFLACLGLSGTGAAEVQPAYETKLEWKACWFQGEFDWPEMECGVLEVPENRAKPAGRKVRLPFVIFKAFEPDDRKLPVLVTGGGGPGNPVGIPTSTSDKMYETAWSNTSAMSVYNGRDLIVVDNRGVGSAQPRLDCPEISAMAIRELEAPSALAEGVKKSARAYAACRERLLKAGIDINAYNNVTAAQDIEDLRVALGLPVLNLYGVSYGTRIALTYLRDFPRTINAVVLDGVDAPEVRLFEYIPKLSYESIKRVFDLCRDDASCRTRYGADLYARFLAFLPQLEEAPIALRVTDPKSMMPLEIVLTPELLVHTLYATIYFNDNIGLVPRAVAALMNGSLDYIAELVRDQVVSFITVGPLDYGAYASYQCHGIVPYNDLSHALEEASKYPVQSYMNHGWIHYEKAMCEAWQAADGGPIEAEAVASNVPVLLYSGEYDPITPHSAALSAARTLRNARVKEWPGIAHNVLSMSYCADRIAGAFYDNPFRNPLGDSCLQDEAPPKLEFY